MSIKNLKITPIHDDNPETIQPVKKDHRIVTKMDLIRAKNTKNEAVIRLTWAVKYHQDNFISLRTISLSRRLYDKFFDFMNELICKQKNVELNKKEYYNGNCKLNWHEVDIVRGSIFQKEYMMYEEYFKSHEQKSAIFSDKIRPKFNA